MKDEALRLALEALGHFEKAGLATLKTIDAITAIKQALEQPEPEPVAWADMDVRGEDKGLSWTPGHFHKTPLYTTPPQRTWVRLTDEELDEICLGDEAKVRTALELIKEKNT